MHGSITESQEGEEIIRVEYGVKCDAETFVLFSGCWHDGGGLCKLSLSN